MKETFKENCKLLRDRLDLLNNKLEELKQRIIIQDLSDVLGVSVKAGSNRFTELDWLDEIMIDGEGFTLINKSKEKYFSYVVYTEKDYRNDGLGYPYKNDIISPQYEFGEDEIIRKYNAEDVSKILSLIIDEIKRIDSDIKYLEANPSLDKHSHYYGEYNKGFKSVHRFESINDVINDFIDRWSND